MAQETAPLTKDVSDIEQARKVGIHDENDGDDRQEMVLFERCNTAATSPLIDASSNTVVSDGRDEVKEVQKVTAEDTQKVNCWRYAMAAALLVTAFAVTMTTYRLLQKEETESFETAFEQFSRTVGDAAIDHQKDRQESIRTLEDTISIHAESNNLTWPFVTIPRFERFGANFRRQSHAEILSLNPLVKADEEEDYLKFVEANRKQSLEENHLIHYGNLDKLKDKTGVTYMPYMTTSGIQPGQPVIRDSENRTEYWPCLQVSPPPPLYMFLNMNAGSLPNFAALLPSLLDLKNETLLTNVTPFVSAYAEEHKALHSNSEADNPHTYAWYPVHKNSSDYNSKIVAVLGVATAWDTFLLNLLPDNVQGIHAVILNNCDQAFTYEIRGHDAVYIGDGDQHERRYDDMKIEVDLALHTHPNFTKTTGHCQYFMHMYPTSEFRSTYDSNTPEVFAAVVAVTFVIVAAIFLTYDLFVQRRNDNLINTAAESNAVLNSLFPEHMRDRYIEQKSRSVRRSADLKSFLKTSSKGPCEKGSKPMADLYLDTTVVFADISGFTAWSSTREPTQVFLLLESIYHAFDILAKKQKIFKIETVGDSYVAVAGLPDPNPDHAVVMGLFARSILSKMQQVTRKLEMTLGPGTGELMLRVGIHSGPVTGGILRGERARFQLFGDTMNTCSRIESSGEPGRIHCSKETAELINIAGKGSWLEKRKEAVSLKGKGTLETYWLNIQEDLAKSVSSHASVEFALLPVSYGPKLEGLDERIYRLIDWNVEMLLQILKQLGACRAASKMKSASFHKLPSFREGENSGTPLDEVCEIISLPEFNEKTVVSQRSPDDIHIPHDVVEQLHLLVSKVASMYNDNPFHNFDHASHVVMSVIKLMSRIVAPSNIGNMDDSDKAAAKSLHDHTYGITSDPLTQFACAFSALIHDVDHVGISNAQLVKEGAPIAKKYNDRSVAEQNSLDLSWDLLMGSEFTDLQDFLFPTPAELSRFRQLVVNSVMSTDIVDQDMKALRNARWDKAFKQGDSADHVDANKRDEVNRKATIVIEHIIQASDISHTMQHWHVYRKWNQKLFEELYVAYLAGRMERDPSTFWYKGEFGFFDFYIIPLTRKLKECGVFGVSSDEYLNYALKNREEWESKGEEVVASMLEDCQKKYGTRENPVSSNGNGMDDLMAGSSRIGALAGKSPVFLRSKTAPTSPPRSKKKKLRTIRTWTTERESPIRSHDGGAETKNELEKNALAVSDGALGLGRARGRDSMGTTRHRGRSPRKDRISSPKLADSSPIPEPGADLGEELL